MGIPFTKESVFEVPLLSYPKGTWEYLNLTLIREVEYIQEANKTGICR